MIFNGGAGEAARLIYWTLYNVIYLTKILF